MLFPIKQFTKIDTEFELDSEIQLDAVHQGC